MTLRVEQNIVWFHVSVYNALSVNVSKRTAQLCHPEPDGIVGEGLSRDMKSKITAIH